MRNTYRPKCFLETLIYFIIIPTISPQDWLRQGSAKVLLDVRSPGEFAHGHWPGARNLPLFSNEERAEVGTLYKQTSPDAAFLRGLEFVGQKMRWYVEEARRLAPEGKVVLHCWRGGQRSQSMAWLLAKALPEVTVIEGGYKALRHAGRALIAGLSRPLWILGGPTGAGKTKVLYALREQGATVIDLEEMAHHKGSSFGALGEAPQPTVEQFENDIFAAFAGLENSDEPIWLENESRSIGRVYLPNELWELMTHAALVQLAIPQDWRIENLVTDYASYPVEELIDAFNRIGKRLGGQHVKAATEAVQAGDFATAAAIALRYYDKAYQGSLEKNGQQPLFSLTPTDNNPNHQATQLLNAQRNWSRNKSET